MYMYLIMCTHCLYLPTFRSYLDLIDLTKDSDSSSDAEESNGDDDSVLPEISLTHSTDRSGYHINYVFFIIILCSTSHFEHFKADSIKVKHILLQHHQLKVITGENEDMQPIHVRRKHILLF
jgi:hypothetical protein